MQWWNEYKNSIMRRRQLIKNICIFIFGLFAIYELILFIGLIFMSRQKSNQFTFDFHSGTMIAENDASFRHIFVDIEDSTNMIESYHIEIKDGAPSLDSLQIGSILPSSYSLHKVSHSSLDTLTSLPLNRIPIYENCKYRIENCTYNTGSYAITVKTKNHRFHQI